jgi:hypothetical protein
MILREARMKANKPGHSPSDSTVLDAWRDLVAQEIVAEDEDDDF